MRGPASVWIDRLLGDMKEKGVTREALAKGAVRKPDAPRILFADRKFQTGSGRFNLITDFPDEPPAPPGDYPLRLMSSSTYRNQSSQVPVALQQEPPDVTIHPEAAQGRREGDLVRLASPIASVIVRLRFDPKQRPDTVIYHKGRWGKFGGPNSLTRAVTTDFGEGAAYYDEGVRLE